MIHGPLADPDYKGQFSGHQTFPLRQLWLRKAYNGIKRAGVGSSKSMFSDPDSIITFGVGKNMVSAIRHWATVCNVIENCDDGFRATEFGEFLFNEQTGRDPYVEMPATVWLIHWMIAGSPPPRKTTTWFYAFHNFTAHTFDRETLAGALLECCENFPKWPKSSSATIKRDIECFIRSYLPLSDNRFIDDSMDTLLSELNLIQPVDSRTFRFRRGAKPGLPDGVFLFALHEFWEKYAPQQNTLSVENIAYAPGSPGRAFKLDESSLIERLVNIDQTSDNRYTWSESAGIRNVSRQTNDIDKFDLLDLAYPEDRTELRAV